MNSTNGTAIAGAIIEKLENKAEQQINTLLEKTLNECQLEKKRLFNLIDALQEEKQSLMAEISALKQKL